MSNPVQATTFVSNGLTAQTITIPATGPGDSLILVINLEQYGNGGTQLNLISAATNNGDNFVKDGQGNAQTGNTIDVEAWRCQNPTVGSTSVILSVNIGGPGPTVSGNGCVYETTALVASPVDGGAQTISNSAGGVASPQSTSAMCTNASGDFSVLWIDYTGTISGYAGPGAGWSTPGHGFYQVTAGPATIAATSTYTGTADSWVQVQVSYAFVSSGSPIFPAYPIYAFGAVAPGTNGAGPTDSGSPKLTFSHILNPVAPPSSPPSGFVPGSYVQGAGHAGR